MDIKRKTISLEKNSLFRHFFEALVKLFYIPLVDYMYDLMCHSFWQKISTFFGFEAISKKCYELWSIAKLDAALSFVKSLN